MLIPANILQPRLATAPAVEPITLDEAKEHLRVTGDDEDGYISGLIRAARVMCENQIDRSFITTAWRVTTDQFPCAYECLIMPRPPLIAVQSITYVDTGGVTQTLSNTLYTVDATSEPGRITPGYTLPWPVARYYQNSVVINYTAGYGAVGSLVPETIRHAIKIMVSHLFELREPVNVGNIVTQIPMSANALLDLERWTIK